MSIPLAWLPRAVALPAAISLVATLLVPQTTAAQARLPAHCTREVGREGRTARETARDSARDQIREAVRQELTAAARDAGIQHPAGIVIMQLEVRRGRGRAWGIRSNLPDSLIVAVLQRVTPRLAQWPQPHRGEVFLNLRLDGRDPPRLAQGDTRTSCRPVLLDQVRATQEVTDFAYRTPSARHDDEVRVRALVTRDGDVVYVDLSRPSTNALLNSFALQWMQRLRFVPATVAGEPVDVWVEQPVRVSGSVRTDQPVP